MVNFRLFLFASSIDLVVGGLSAYFGAIIIQLAAIGTSRIWDMMLIRVVSVVFLYMCFCCFLLLVNVVDYSGRVFSTSESWRMVWLELPHV